MQGIQISVFRRDLRQLRAPELLTGPTTGRKTLLFPGILGTIFAFTDAQRQKDMKALWMVALAVITLGTTATAQKEITISNYERKVRASVGQEMDIAAPEATTHEKCEPITCLLYTSPSPRDRG